MIPLKRILLAEDNSRDVELILAALEEIRLANAVDVARDGVEALDYLHGRGRFAGRLPGLPVVMFTSSREDPDLAECYALGANAYVVKPVGFDEFAAATRQVGVFWALLNEPAPVNSSTPDNT